MHSVGAAGVDLVHDRRLIVHFRIHRRIRSGLTNLLGRLASATKRGSSRSTNPAQNSGNGGLAPFELSALTA